MSNDDNLSLCQDSEKRRTADDEVGMYIHDVAGSKVVAVMAPETWGWQVGSVKNDAVSYQRASARMKRSFSVSILLDPGIAPGLVVAATRPRRVDESVDQWMRTCSLSFYRLGAHNGDY